MLTKLYLFLLCKCFCCFVVYMVIIETQNRRPNNTQKTSAQSYKTPIKILLFPGLAKSDSEQPGPGATLLGWPKSIYYIYSNRCMQAMCPRLLHSFLWSSQLHESLELVAISVNVNLVFWRWDGFVSKLKIIIYCHSRLQSSVCIRDGAF